MLRVLMMTETTWLVNEKVNQDMTTGTEEMNLQVESKDEVMRNI